MQQQEAEQAGGVYGTSAGMPDFCPYPLIWVARPTVSLRINCGSSAAFLTKMAASL